MIIDSPYQYLTSEISRSLRQSPIKNEVSKINFLPENTIQNVLYPLEKSFHESFTFKPNVTATVLQTAFPSNKISEYMEHAIQLPNLSITPTILGNLDNAKVDFRIKVSAQETFRNLSELFTQSFQSINVDSNDSFVDFDEKLSEFLAKTHEESYYDEKICAIEKAVVQIYEKQERGQETLDKIAEHTEKNDNPTKFFHGKLGSFIGSCSKVITLVETTKYAYKLIAWLNDFIQTLS
ncbi:hypothetical protein TMU3MR103_0603 [Tetragenococcus muriaticus 3MR10-3]|uniref:Uncharacterized protein n=1 Tax=Tetragenococcus muriaticus 3MR10-3 TaxID=1302648 RepID=A0A091C7N3_9ENTE|nr:hypothetical protein TMU3MR103_0603 [Tetragenococcus muriaticus 3MR10-3]